MSFISNQEISEMNLKHIWCPNICTMLNVKPNYGSREQANESQRQRDLKST